MNSAFKVTGKTLAKFPDVIRAAALVKAAQAKANARFGWIRAEEAEAIEAQCDGIAQNIPECLCSEFWASDLSVLSDQMNAFIAEKAELSAEALSRFDNAETFSQTVESIVIAHRLAENLPKMRELAQALAQKALLYADEVRLSRIHLQEGSPSTWGRVFGALAASTEQVLARLESDRALFRTVLAGSVLFGHAKAPKEYAEALALTLSDKAGLDLSTPESGYALDDSLMGGSRLMLLASDLRALVSVWQRFVHGFFIYGSGPRAGISEITLPAIAPGSTIMPGKINPSMAMLLEQAFQYLAAVNETTVYGYNEFDFDEAYISSGAFIMTAEAVELLGKCASLFVAKCLNGFEVRSDISAQHLAEALSHTKIIAGLLGTEAARRTAVRAEKDGSTVCAACVAEELLSQADADRLFDFKAIAKDGLSVGLISRCLAMK